GSVRGEKRVDFVSVPHPDLSKAALSQGDSRVAGRGVVQPFGKVRGEAVDAGARRTRDAGVRDEKEVVRD
ncbi:hypothetical protein, partial [Mycobacterium tuberculosis]|uniref:hypothetical protein n=1 Tax=Mycobacterium tuberculosis TaxID=1773 RepID=UPI001BDBF062